MEPRRVNANHLIRRPVFQNFFFFLFFLMYVSYLWENSIYNRLRVLVFFFFFSTIKFTLLRLMRRIEIEIFKLCHVIWYPLHSIPRLKCVCIASNSHAHEIWYYLLSKKKIISKNLNVLSNRSCLSLNCYCFGMRVEQ